MQEYSLEEKIFGALLKVALEEAYRQEVEKMGTLEELNEKYKPSPELDKKIRAIIDNYEKYLSK